ncbi:MAG: hypothetical protein V2B20_05540 [Pseudomonadota bacterium]
MKFCKSSIVASLVAVCFFFVAFASQPVEAKSSPSGAAISAPVKHKKVVKKTKKAKRAKKAKKVNKAKKPKKSVSKPARQFSPADPAAQ